MKSYNRKHKPKHTTKAKYIINRAGIVCFSRNTKKATKKYRLMNRYSKYYYVLLNRLKKENKICED